ncbi:hypothetical protein McPS_23040 [Marichromatium sp. PS1]
MAALPRVPVSDDGRERRVDLGLSQLWGGERRASGPPPPGARPFRAEPSSRADEARRGRRARGGGGGTLSVGKVFDMAVRGVLILLVGLLVVTLIGLTAVESVSWAALLNLGVMVFALVLYFLPALVAQERRHTKAVAIFVLDLFLGWTFLGWVGALVWAFTEDNRDRATEAGVNDPASTARG